MSDPEAVPPTRGRTSPRWVKIALALSLSLNLLVLGLAGGAALGVHRAGGDGPGMRSLGLGPFARGLDRADRAALRDRIDRGGMRVQGQALARALRDVARALRADPFDRASADAALTHARGAAGEMQAVGHRALLDRFEAMTPRDRAAVADRVERTLHRQQGRGPGPGADRP